MTEPAETPGHEGEDFRSFVVYVIKGKPLVFDSEKDGDEDADFYGLIEAVVAANGAICFFRLFDDGQFVLAQTVGKKGVDNSAEERIAEDAVHKILQDEGLVRTEVPAKETE